MFQNKLDRTSRKHFKCTSESKQFGFDHLGYWIRTELSGLRRSMLTKYLAAVARLPLEFQSKMDLKMSSMLSLCSQIIALEEICISALLPRRRVNVK